MSEGETVASCEKLAEMIGLECRDRHREVEEDEKLGATALDGVDDERLGGSCGTREKERRKTKRNLESSRRSCSGSGHATRTGTRASKARTEAWRSAAAVGGG